MTRWDGHFVWGAERLVAYNLARNIRAHMEAQRRVCCCLVVSPSAVAGWADGWNIALVVANSCPNFFSS